MSRNEGITILRQDDYAKGQLVTIGWKYGLEYGGHLGACIVMSILMNRVRHGWGNLLDILNRIPQFSAEVEIPNQNMVPQIWEPAFIRLLQEVDNIYDGTKDYSKGALYWCDMRRVETPFFKDKILGDKENHPRVGDMNSLTFFS